MVAPAFREAVQCQTPYHWAAAYAVCALGLLGLSLFSRDPEGSAPVSTRSGERSP